MEAHMQLGVAEVEQIPFITANVSEGRMERSTAV